MENTLSFTVLSMRPFENILRFLVVSNMMNRENTKKKSRARNSMTRSCGTYVKMGRRWP